MIVTCEHCSARYKLDDEKIKGKGARITCPRCKHVFVVLAKPDGAQPEAPVPPPAAAPAVNPPPPQPPPQPPPPEPVESRGASAEIGGGRRADQLDFRKVGIATWKVRVKIGLVYDFSDTSTLRKYIQDRRVTEDDVISHDGTNWVRIGEIPDLDAYFVQVYKELEAQRGDDEEDSGEEEFAEGPTMVVGMGSLRSNISTGVFARPQPPHQEASTAAPRPSPQPVEPTAPAGQRFVDPFESLKARQRDRMRANRRNGAPQGRRVNGGASEKDEAPSRRNLWLAAAAFVALIGGGYYFLRGRSTPRPIPADLAATAPGPSTSSADAVRARLIEQLEIKLQPTSTLPPDPLEDPSADPVLQVVIPSDAVIHRASAEPDRQTPSAGQGGNEPTVTVAKTTAADFMAAARTSERAGDWGGAVRAYRDALALEPRNGDIKLALGVALYRKGDLDPAIAELSSLASAGKCPAKLWMARSLRDSGDVAGASGNYSAYLQCNPGDSTAQRELQQLTGG